MDKRQLYKTLQVPVGASTEELKEAYRRLAKRFHPDITKNRESGEQFARIVHAYRVLSEHNQRKSVIDFPVREGYKQKTDSTKTVPDVFSLGKLLENGKTVGIRAFAARALGNSGKKSAYAYLRRSLYDKEPLVVKAVVEAIGKLCVQQSAGELGSVFNRGNREIKQAVLRAVENIGCTPHFQSIITTGMKDSDPAIRKKALNLFIRSKKERSYAANGNP
jgi:HEAT repeat protein